MNARLASTGRTARQRGAMLPFSVVAVAIMMLGAVALVATMNAGTSGTANFAIQRDMAQQGERGLAAAIAALDTGALASGAARESSLQSANYSATMLPVSPSGVPTALATDTEFALVGQSANDIAVAGQGITVRYVIDRMCGNTGAASSIHCRMLSTSTPPGGSGSELLLPENSSSGGAGALSDGAIYRVSVRVDGPRGARSFFQATLGR